MRLFNTFIMRGLVIWALAATLIAALPGNFHISTTAIATSTTTTTLKELDDATISLETIPEELNTATTTVSLIEQSDVVDDDTATPTWMVKPGRPTRTVVPDWITPPFNPVVDNPPYDPASQDLLAAYQADAPQNNIPERIMAGPSSRSNVAPSNDGGTRQIMFHQDAIFIRWGAEIFRSMMLDPQNVLPNHPGLAQNGEIWPRQMRQGGHLIPSATSGGELDLFNDLILEFPFGEGYSYFGTDFANLTPPGQAPRRHIPSNHLLIFGYHRQDVALQRPLYIGMVTREGYTATSRTNWHWCPVVNYDATPGPPRNAYGHPWQGINPTFRLGTIAYFLRDWLMTTPFVKQPRRHQRLRLRRVRDCEGERDVNGHFYDEGGVGRCDFDSWRGGGHRGLCLDVQVN
ncbi:hypothetical protein F5B17DRAFT_435842 [Nemania serpens]|nr:hypothetical protein F5B17DRAFT_435842 [Nemania serpens]